MKLYYENKKCDNQVIYPDCRRRYCNYGADYDRKCKDCDKEKEYEKKCIYKCRECEKCHDRHEYKHCCPKNQCPYPVLFECTQGTGTRIEQTIVCNGTTGSTNFFYPRSLGCLNLDTTCLKNPVVKFDFCAVINYISGGESTIPVRLVFQLFKTCDEGQEVPCGTWDFAVALDTEDEQITTSFNFCYCECNSCPGCCKYSVRLVEAVNINADDVVNVCHVTLSAIAKSGC